MLSPGFANALVAANQRSQSWREKLDSVRELLLNDAAPLTVEQLVDVVIYLRFLGAGQIRCVEDGRHFRPAHHARIALQIQERLAKISEPDTASLVREIYPWLPSSSRTFQRAEPLTRIRDIAHRNDIPQDLKHEIKHSLQNKLHRCAGPEDLATSSMLLQRITAPGANYSGDFVEQFKIFHDELKEFFNARSLDERLFALLPNVGENEASQIHSFLKLKTANALPEQLAAFRVLTELRHALLNAVEKQSGAETQEFLLTDIGLEDFAFVLLSKIINAFDAASVTTWETWLDTLQLAITNLALSGVETNECRAIESELRAWRQDFNSSDREQLLRVKATTDRARRVAESYSDRLLALFPPRVETLGRALGVDERAIRVFCDAEIRSHLVFQLSKLVSSLLRRVREQLALPAWDVVVSGHAIGRVKTIGTFSEWREDGADPALLLLKKAEGDEEIPRSIAAIVLAHDIPHLSHLAVRARQAEVILVACEAAEAFDELQSLQGKMISLSATAEKVTWEITSAHAGQKKNTDHQPAHVPEVELVSKCCWLPLDQVRANNGGAKADGARRLAELASRNSAGFKTPPAIVIPFGVMESALRATPATAREYRELCSRINALTGKELETATERLRDLIHQLSVPAQIISETATRFGQMRLMVRSSANCEDLEELAGAGLYDSIANVVASDLAEAVRAVWASLWTPRATASRKEVGISHERAHMAVLIQQLLAPDFSFVLHTTNPINHNPREVYAEIAVGLGETLASAAARGNPYRMVCDKTSGEVTLLAFASFSHALQADSSRNVIGKVVDYSQVKLSCDAEFRKQLGRRLANIAQFIEEAFQKPQDIEGAVLGDAIFLVQSRPQQGLPRKQP